MGRVGTDIGIKLLPVMCFSEFQDIYIKYSNGTSTQCYANQYPSLFPALFLQSLYVPFELLAMLDSVN